MTQEHSAESIKTREGITFMQATRLFSTEVKAEDWFIQKRWGSRANVICPKCGKPAVVGIKDRPTNQVAAKVVIVADAPTLTGFVHEQTKPETMVFTEAARAYDHIKRPRRTVKHSIKEFVNAMVHTNGMESHWAMLKRGMVGVYHDCRFKHLPWYVNEFTGQHSQRPLDTKAQMGAMVCNGVAKRLRYVGLIGP